MKTINYKNSKKLAEIGFEAETEKCYDKNGNLISCHRKICFLRKRSSRTDEVYGWPAYDLETLIEALPKFIEDQPLVVDIGFDEIYYKGDGEKESLFITTILDNESLADMVARLLIKLHEKGVVKFGGENE